MAQVIRGWGCGVAAFSSQLIGQMNSTVLCTPETATCEMWDASTGCYPCSWPRIGANCTSYWPDTNAPHGTIAALLYSSVGIWLGTVFTLRLWAGRNHLKSYASWRTMDIVWSICAFAAFLFVPRFLTKPLWGISSPQLVFSNMLDISTTLCLINIEILMVTEWVSIMRVKGRGNTKSKYLLYTQRAAIVLLWSISLLGAIMEQAILPVEGEPGSQKLPLALTGGSLFDFRGTYNTRWNAVKNLNHGFIGSVYSAIGIVAGITIMNQLKNTNSPSTQKVVKKIMEYLIGIFFCVMLDLAYAVITAASRLSQEWYFDYPNCSAISEYIYSADILKIICFSVVIYLTRHSQRTGSVHRMSSSSRSISMSSKAQNPTREGVIDSQQEMTTKYISEDASTALVSEDASTTVLVPEAP